ncbi:MAG: hypothetical protein NT169_03260 [Chloroflexi bacterium]|nr:hypothetical protein [Chloroflexota bacterium]
MDKQLTPTGAKAHQRSDTEWRSQPYSDWHRTLPRWFWMTDVDFIEWRLRNGKLTAVAVMDFRTDCSEFWVYNLSDRTGWKHFPAQAMEEFLAGL